MSLFCSHVGDWTRICRKKPKMLLLNFNNSITEEIYDMVNDTTLCLMSMTLVVGPAHSFYGDEAPIKHIITRYTDFHVVDEWGPGSRTPLV